MSQVAGAGETSVARVIRAYVQPYADPIRVAAGERVEPDFARETDISGWVWCKDARGREGWVPRGWMREENGRWWVMRDFDALELSVRVGEEVTVLEREASFIRVRTADGRVGWIPEAHVE